MIAQPTILLAAGEALTLVGWWKAIILLLPILPWAWLVSTVLDKHALRFHLPRQAWGNVHLICGLVAFLVAILLPLPSQWAFLAGFGIIVAILAADVIAFAAITNKDERVPAAFKLKLDFSKFAEARAKKAAAKQQGKSELIIRGPDKSVLAPPASDTPEFQVRVAAEGLLIKGMESRAAQIELAPANKDLYQSAFLVDGMKVAGPQFPAPDAVKIIDLWKASGKLDINERRKKLQADVNIERGVDKKKVRLITAGAQAGQRLTMVFDPEASVRRAPDKLGLLDTQLEELKTLVAGKGVVLLTAPALQGRTTTMYSVLKLHDAYTSNIQTVELEPQDQLEGIRQNKWDPTAEGPDFATLVRSIVRRDPDTVATAELPDGATAKEISKCDLDRTRVYVSFKADGALQAVQTWMKAVEDPEKGSAKLEGVVAERLIRKLCVNCRTPYAPTPDMLKKLGLPADKVKQLFKKGGQVLIKNKPEVCPVCQGSGYNGQEGVFEVFRFGPEERAMIKEGNLAGLRAELRKKQAVTIAQAALRKAVEGVTSVEEVLRISGEGQAPAKPEGSAKPDAGGKPAGAPAAGAKPASPGAAPGATPGAGAGAKPK